MMRKFLIFCLTLSSLFIIHYSFVEAVCPVCTIAVGGGLLLSKYLGVDDLVSGVWVGGLILALGLWTGSVIKKKLFAGQNWVLTAFLWVTTVLALKQAGFIGNPTCKIHGHDKLLSGIVFGSIAFVAGFFLDFLLRRINKKNPGKAVFPYQRVVLPLFWLILATVFAFQLCRFGV